MILMYSSKSDECWKNSGCVNESMIATSSQIYVYIHPGAHHCSAVTMVNELPRKLRKQNPFKIYPKRAHSGNNPGKPLLRAKT
jgi:hypothetical protein